MRSRMTRFIALAFAGADLLTIAVLSRCNTVYMFAPWGASGDQVAR